MGKAALKKASGVFLQATGYISGSRVVPGNSSSIGNPLSVFATVNGSTAR